MEGGTPTRLEGLDVLRGLALLGILPINIQGFALVAAAFPNPTVQGGMEGLNWLAWLCGHLFAEQKFLTLFSFLFGAGIVLIADRQAQAGVDPLPLHIRRMLWLMIFGLLHGYLLWYGDILFAYGVCGMLAYAAWRLRPSAQLALGLACIALPSALLVWQGLTAPLPGSTEHALLDRFWNPPAAAIAAEVQAYRGGFAEQMAQRGPMMTLMVLSLPLEAGWRIGGLMLVGMACIRNGFLTGAWSLSAYKRTALVGALIGLPLIGLGVMQNVAHDWAPRYTIYWGSQYNYWGSLALAAAYASLAMLICQRQWLAKLRLALAAVGRLALSNYLLQTLLATTLFYGHGLGLFARLQRAELAIVVATIWLIQIAWSLYWLRRHRYGPLEWLWRTLSRGGLQP